jgi:hypothetical protein
MEVEPWKENHGHEMAHPSSAADTLLGDISSQQVQKSGSAPINLHTPAELIGLKGLQGEPDGKSSINVKFWEVRLESSLAAMKTCTDSKRREQLEATIERARDYLACA